MDVLKMNERMNCEKLEQKMQSIKNLNYIIFMICFNQNYDIPK